MLKRTPDACTWLLQPRPRDFLATKSKSSCTSEPDMKNVVMVFLKGNTLKSCSLVTTPGAIESRMPAEFVSAKSDDASGRVRMASATRLPRAESPPVAAERDTPL